jgi:hypothetical protein
MSDEPVFEVDPKRVVAVAQATGAESIEDAYPAALLAPTWRALLEGGAIQAPSNLDVARVKVRQLGPNKLELLVPVTFEDGDEVVKSVVVLVDIWTASGDIVQQFGSEADVLGRALESAYHQDVVDHEGPGQKPHN